MTVEMNMGTPARPMNEAEIRNVQEAQFSQYTFPYHHIPHFLPDGTGTRIQLLGWGFEYLCSQRDMKETVEGLNPKSVLEVGCGDGGMIGALDRSIPRRMGVDVCKEAIAFAKAFFSDVEFSAMDAAEVQETFDVVMAVEVLEHIPDHSVSRFLRILADRTKTGGHVFLSVPSNNIPLKEKHFRHYDEQRLRSELQASGVPLEIISLRHLYRPTRLAALYQKLTNNRLWSGELHPLRRLVWDHTWRAARTATKHDSRHLVAVMVKR